MRKLSILASIFLFSAVSLIPCSAQTDNTLYARNFPGKTVGQKVTEAQNACSADAIIPCLIVIDPSLAAFPTGTMPAKCTQCIWMDYRSASTVGAVSSVKGTTGVTCSPTSGDVQCSLDSVLPSTEQAVTQVSTDNSPLVATDEFVQNLVQPIKDIYFGAGTAYASTGQNQITFASSPLVGTVAVYQDGNLISPLDYGVSGTTLTLNGYYFNPGSLVTVFWETHTTPPGGIVLGATANSVPVLRSQYWGNVAGTYGQIVNFPLPPEAQAGDLVVLSFVGGANTGYAISGWTMASGLPTANYIASKVLTVADIQAGYASTTTLDTATGDNFTFSELDFAGSTGGIREIDSTYAATSPASVTTSASVLASDYIAAFAMQRAANPVTISPGAQLNSQSSPNAMTTNIASGSAGAQTFTATYSSATDGTSGISVVVVEAGTSVALSPTGNYVQSIPSPSSPSNYPSMQSMTITSGFCTATGGSYSTCTDSTESPWPHPFSSANYQVTCEPINPTNTGGSLSGSIYNISQTATGITLTLQTDTSSDYTIGSAECIAMQNAGQ